MRRQLVFSAIALIAPIILNIGYELIILICLCGAFLLLGCFRRGLMLLPMAGLILSTLNLVNLKAVFLPEAFVAKAIIADVDIQKVRYFDSQVKLTSVLTSPPMLKGHKVRLNWRKPPDKVVEGDVWRLLIKLKQPWGFANPGAFDYQGFLLREGVSATGYVKSKISPVKIQNSNRVFRAGFNADLGVLLAGVQQASLLRALIDGNKEAVSDQQWRVLQNTGTLHLFVVSGLHIGIMFMLGRGVALWLIRPFVWFVPAVGWRQLSIGVGLGLALAYGYIAGFSLPVVRALSMLLSASFLFLCNRNLPVSTYWLSSMMVVLVMDPLAVFFSGFWLSFAAVGLLIGTFSGVINLSRTKQLIMPQGVVALGLMPILIILSLPVAIQSVFANLLAIPVVTLLLMPALFVEVTFVLLDLPQWGYLLAFIDAVVGGLWWWLSYLSSLPTYHLNQAQVIWPMAFLAVVSMFAVRGLNFIALPVAALLCFFIWPKNQLKEGDFNLWVLDVGQGQSLLVETSKHYLLYDVGGKYGESFSAAKIAVLPFLRRMGVNRLDVLVISHNDRDHSGDFEWLTEQVGFDSQLSGQPKDNGGKGCSGTPSWVWDAVLFEFAPPVSVRNDNNKSCVLRIRSAGGSVLIAGDIEKSAETKLSGWWEPVDVVIAPHHGSNTSSTYGFIQLNAPQYVVFSAAKGNQFGHPHTKVVERYEKANVKSLETSENGNIRFEFRAGLSPEPAALYRQQSSRFWLSG